MECTWATVSPRMQSSPYDQSPAYEWLRVGCNLYASRGSPISDAASRHLRVADELRVPRRTTDGLAYRANELVHRGPTPPVSWCRWLQAVYEASELVYLAMNWGMAALN